MNTVVPTIEAVATRVRIRSGEPPFDPGFTQAMIWPRSRFTPSGPRRATASPPSLKLRPLASCTWIRPGSWVRSRVRAANTWPGRAARSEPPGGLMKAGREGTSTTRGTAGAALTPAGAVDTRAADRARGARPARAMEARLGQGRATNSAR